MIAENAAEAGWITPQVPERLTGKTVAVVGSGPAGLGARPAADALRAHRRRVRAGRRHRWAHAVRDPRVQDGALGPRPPPRADGGRGHPLPSGRGQRLDITGEQLRDASTRSSRHRRHPVARGGPARPRPRRHPPGDGVPAPDEPRRRGPGAPGDSTSRERLDVVVIGGGDTGSDCYGTALRQGAKSVTQLDIYPMAPEDRAEHEPWPTMPKCSRSSSSHEEAVSGSSPPPPGLRGRGRKVTGLRLVEVTKSTACGPPWRHRARPAGSARAAGHRFAGPEHGGIVGQLGLEADARTRFTRTPGYATSTPGVYVAGDAGRGQSLIVWAIAEGRGARPAVDEFLMGDTALPSPIRADAVPLTA